MRLLSYYRARFQHPELRDFTSMGLGIEARYLRCKAYWKRHLDYSKQFQSKCIGTYPGTSVALYGAGRLLDVPEESIKGSFETVHFLDADPLCRVAWEGFRRTLSPQQRFVGHLTDVTGSIEPWTRGAEAFLQGVSSEDRGAFASWLANLEPESAPGLPVDTAISLNILSQLGIYWRERVERLVALFQPDWIDADDCLPEAIERELNASIRRLEEQHLQVLTQPTTRMIVLIHDAFFLYYQKNQSLWQEERALELPLEYRIKGFSLAEQDTWLWHIAPQGIEHAEHGAIHQVQARCFRRIED